MDPEDITVEIRSAALGRLGQVSMELINDLKITRRFCNVGGWTMTLPSESKECVQLAQPGRGLIVTYSKGAFSRTLMSGPVLNWTDEANSDDIQGTTSFIGADDNIILADALAWPEPGNADPTTQKVANDIRTGNAEAVIRQYVAFNIADGDTAVPPATTWATADRKIVGFGLQAVNQNRGATVTGNARFDQMGKLIGDLALAGGVGFDIVQTTATKRELQIFVPSDKSKIIRMDIDNDLLDKTSYGFGAPTGTRFIVAGQGEGTQRQMVIAKAPAIETQWGRKVEIFKDRRDTADPTQLTQEATQGIADNGRTITSLSVTPSDNVTMVFGRDWFLGDKVGVVVDSQELSAVVTEAIISISENGVLVAATIGDPVGFDYESKLISNQQDQEARIAFLEKNSEIGVTSGSTASRIATYGDTSAMSALQRSSLAVTQPTWQNTDTGRLERYYCSLDDAAGTFIAMSNAHPDGAGWYDAYNYLGSIGRTIDMDQLAGSAYGLPRTSWQSYVSVNSAQSWPGNARDALRATRSKGGIVILSGLMTNAGAAIGAFGQIGQLPPGFRPDRRMWFPINNSDVSNGIYIDPDGKIYNGNAVTISTGSYLSFDGISYPAAGVATWTDIGAAGSGTAFAGAWAAYGGFQPRYWKDPNTGVVWLDGMITNPTAANWANETLMFTLPTTHQSYKQAHMVTNTNYVLGLVGVTASGTAGPVAGSGVLFKTHSPAQTSGFISLGGIKIITQDALTKLRWWSPRAVWNNAWVNYDATSYTQFQLGLANDGVVYSSGLIKSGTLGSKFTIPPRNYQTQYRQIHHAVAANARARIDLRGADDQEVYSAAYAPGAIIPQQGSNAWFSMDNHCWFADLPTP